MRSSIIFFLLLSTAAFSQNTLIKGRILSAKDNQPLPYVNLMMQKRALGTSSDKNGFYAVKVPDSILNEKIRLSSVGYEQKILSLKDLGKGLVYLQPKTEDLAEVYISKILEDQHVTIRPNWKKEVIGIGNLNGGLYPSIIAKKIGKPEKIKGDCFLEELTIYFYQTREQQDISPKFRLHIYSVAENGAPGKEILGDYILEKSENRSKLEIDLLEEKIRVPQEGVFIGLEHLFIKENQFKEVKDYYINDSLVAQDFETIKYAPIYRGSLLSRDAAAGMYYYEPGGWVRIENWELSTEFFGNRIPSPVFKLKFTN